jgi:hypothetical protein
MEIDCQIKKLSADNQKTVPVHPKQSQISRKKMADK